MHVHIYVCLHMYSCTYVYAYIYLYTFLCVKSLHMHIYSCISPCHDNTITISLVSSGQVPCPNDI